MITWSAARNHVENHVASRTIWPERKGRYVKDDTAITRPDNRTPEAPD